MKKNTKHRKSPNEEGAVYFLGLLTFSALVIAVFLLIYKTSKQSPREIIGSTLGIQSAKELQSDALRNKKIAEASTYLGDAPNPIEKIQMEGTLASDPRKIQTITSLKDVEKIYVLSYAYHAGGDMKFLNKSEEFLLDWASTYLATGNSIDESHLGPLFEGYRWVKADLSRESAQKVDSWLYKIAIAEKNTRYMGERDVNNWNSHRINIIGQIGYLINDKKLIDYAIKNYKLQIYQNLNKDGSSYDFQTRDALHYHSYNIWPLLNFAKTAKINGYKEDLYTYESEGGSSLVKSVHFLYPYATGEKTHAEFVNSTVPWDVTSGSKKADGSAKIWDPKTGLYIFELAYFFDESALPIVQKLRNNYAEYPSFEIMVAAIQKEQLR